MQADEARTFFDYNGWANERVLEAAVKVGPDSYSGPAGLTFGNLHGTLLHILAAEQVWSSRVRDGMSPSKLLDSVDVPDLGTLVRRSKEERMKWLEYLADTASEDMGGDVVYRSTAGQQFSTPLWHIVLHVVNHGTQFRGEAAIFLTQNGHSPGDLDFINYVRNVSTPQ